MSIFGPILNGIEARIIARAIEIYCWLWASLPQLIAVHDKKHKIFVLQAALLIAAEQLSLRRSWRNCLSTNMRASAKASICDRVRRRAYECGRARSLINKIKLNKSWIKKSVDNNYFENFLVPFSSRCRPLIQDERGCKWACEILN